MVKCEICNNELKSYVALAQHIKNKHNISSEDYYIKYIKDRSYCAICNKPTRFTGLKNGYKVTCSSRCAAIYSTDKRKQTCLSKYGVENPAQNSAVKDKIRATVLSDDCQNKTKNTCLQKYGSTNFNSSIYRQHKSRTNSQLGHATRNKLSDQYEIENNCTRISKLISKYGQGWLHIKDQLHVTHNSGYTYISNDDIHLIDDYYNSQHSSYAEQQLIDFIKSIYDDEIIIHSRSIIKPLELDIYLPKLNLAIEYNGNYFHSIEHGISKDYHLKKSMLCRDKNIRLIHIYEFEDIQHQMKLLKDLIFGIDSYPKNDWNKNNLINGSPSSTIIYKTTNLTIYGVGSLLMN